MATRRDEAALHSRLHHAHEPPSKRQRMPPSKRQRVARPGPVSGGSSVRYIDNLDRRVREWEDVVISPDAPHPASCDVQRYLSEQQRLCGHLVQHLAAKGGTAASCQDSRMVPVDGVDCLNMRNDPQVGGRAAPRRGRAFFSCFHCIRMPVLTLHCLFTAVPWRHPPAQPPNTQRALTRQLPRAPQGLRPSLMLHLYPTHFRIDNQPFGHE